MCNLVLLYWFTKFYFNFNENKSFTTGCVFQSQKPNSNLFHLSLDTDKRPVQVFAVEYLLLTKGTFTQRPKRTKSFQVFVKTVTCKQPLNKSRNCHNVTSEDHCIKTRRYDHPHANQHLHICLSPWVKHVFPLDPVVLTGTMIDRYLPSGHTGQSGSAVPIATTSQTCWEFSQS